MSGQRVAGSGSHTRSHSHGRAGRVRRKGLFGGRVNTIARRRGANKRMIYHYFGNKEGLYLAALERVYEGLRGSERTLDLADLAPETAIKRLVEFNFDYWRRHPELISLINSENLHRARICASKKVRELHSPFVKLIGEILSRGVAKGVFRRGLDPVDFISPSRRCRSSICRTTGHCPRFSAALGTEPPAGSAAAQCRDHSPRIRAERGAR